MVNSSIKLPPSSEYGAFLTVSDMAELLKVSRFVIFSFTFFTFSTIRSFLYCLFRRLNPRFFAIFWMLCETCAGQLHVFSAWRILKES